MTHGVKYLFMCLLVYLPWRNVYSSLYRNVYSSPLPIFELGFLMLLLSCISLYSVDINPLAVYDLQIFSPIPLVVYVLTSHNDTLRSVVRNSLKN